MNCIYCQKPTTPVVPGVNECPGCESLVSTEPAPKYEANYHAYRFSWFRPKLPYLAIKALRSGLRRGLTVCDIGCGAGHALAFAQWFGCTTVGYDIPEAEPHVGGCRFYHYARSLRHDYGGSCDLVWCWHALEHTEEATGCLRMCMDVLKPGGEAWIEFPDASAIRTSSNGDLKARCMFPEHRGIPSRTWALRTLINLGASVVTVQPPRNPTWLYGRRDGKTDVVLRVRKR